jgi:LysM repeat protein
MDKLRPVPRKRRPVSERAARLISYAWVIASLALPAVGLVLLSEGRIAAPPESATSYLVQAGDTLSAIAARYGVTLEELMQVNGLNNPNLIYVGQELIIPQKEVGAAQIYTVRSGDTLSAIAARYGVTVEAIMQANGLANANMIFAGQQLQMPVEDVAAVAEVVETSTTYALQRGDSLYRVSLIYGVSVDDLLAANNLASPNSIYPGLELRIPSISASTVAGTSGATPETTAGIVSTGGTIYTVALGDTLSRIAIDFNTTVDGIIAANGLTNPSRIYVGQTLTIPAAGASARPAGALAGTSHAVAAGETLSEIALKYGVTISALAAANDIDNPSRIYVGMVLSIPSAQAGTSSVQYASVGTGLCPVIDITQSGTGYFIRPTRGYRITQYFHPWHPGIDLALPTGSPVFAADGGTVVYAGWNPVGYGNLIVLDHGNGWRTYYAHLSAVNVECGEWVPRGTTMGAIGSTGNSTGPHLHFEMLRYGVAVNPAGYIRF